MNKKFGFLPFSYYNVDALEQWIQAQADQGLRPTHLSSYYIFKDDGIPSTRYCIVHNPKKYLDMNTYPEWNYALSISNLYQVYSTTDPNVEKIPKDFSAIRHQIMKLYWLALFCIFILSVFLINSIQTHLLLDVQPETSRTLYLVLFNFTQPYMILLLFVIIFPCIPILLEQIAFFKQLKASPKENCFSKKRNFTFINAIRFIALPILLIAIFHSHYEDNFIIPLDQYNQPYISLYDIETAPMLSASERFDDPHIISKYKNETYAKRKYSILASTFYETSQTTYATETTTIDGETFIDTYHLKMTKISLFIPQLAKPVAKNFLDGYRAINIIYEYEDISYPDTDFMIYAHTTDDKHQMIAMGKDGDVVVVTYSGTEDLLQHTDLISSVMNG